MELVREFTFRGTLAEFFEVNGGPYGARVVACVDGGSVTGERISGRLVGPSADWAVIGADGYAQIDVRCQIRTDDGANLYMSYNGSLEANEAAMSALATPGAETAFGANYWFTHVRIEAGDERYSWLNRTMFVGHGRAVSDGIEYEIYRLA